MIDYLQSKGVEVRYGYQVTNLNRESNGSWTVDAINRINKEEPLTINAKFVFLGAGGGALHLLQKSGIKEGKGYGGFPVSGLFLRNTHEATAQKHNARSTARHPWVLPRCPCPTWTPAMLTAKRALMFGPYAGFKTNFLKQGSLLDLPCPCA